MKKIVSKYLFSYLLHLFPKKNERQIQKNLGIVSLVCHKDVEFLIYNLNSFFFWLGFQLPVYIIDDGSLTDRDYQLLKKFLSITIEKRADADRKMRKVLKNSPNTFKHRFIYTKNNYKLKLDALLLNPFQRYLYLDADLLFPQPPTELIQWIKNPDKKSFYTAHQTKWFEEDYFSEYSLRKLIYKHKKIKMTAGFSSGLIAVPSKATFTLNDIEKLFSFYESISALHFDALEESALSVLLAKKAKCLNVSEYVVLSLFNEYLDIEDRIESVKMLHFGWETKERIYPTGIRLAAKHSFFRSQQVS